MNSTINISALLAAGVKAEDLLAAGISPQALLAALMEANTLPTVPVAAAAKEVKVCKHSGCANEVRTTEKGNLGTVCEDHFRASREANRARFEAMVAERSKDKVAAAKVEAKVEADPLATLRALLAGAAEANAPKATKAKATKAKATKAKTPKENANRHLAAALRAVGLSAGGETWLAAKALVAKGLTDEQVAATLAAKK